MDRIAAIAGYVGAGIAIVGAVLVAVWLLKLVAQRMPSGSPTITPVAPKPTDRRVELIDAWRLVYSSCYHREWPEEIVNAFGIVRQEVSEQVMPMQSDAAKKLETIE